MACGSCGGARARMAVGSDGQQRLVEPRRTTYVWKWISSDGSASETFKSEDEARTFLKAGNPGSLSLVPVV